MKRTLFYALTASLLLTAAAWQAAAEVEPGFTALSDGKTFNGWKPAEENQDTWTIQDGASWRTATVAICSTSATRSLQELRSQGDVKTDPVSNGGIYFHTRYQPQDWPKGGFECQVNNTHGDWIKTASLYGIVNLADTPAEDSKWWTQEIIVQGNTVTVLIDGKKVS